MATSIRSAADTTSSSTANAITASSSATPTTTEQQGQPQHEQQQHHVASADRSSRHTESHNRHEHAPTTSSSSTTTTTNNKLKRFFHKLSNKLKLGNSSNADSREALLRELGFGLDFVAVVEQPSLSVLDTGAVCMQRLARVQKVFVLSRDEVKGGAVVRIEVTLAPRKDVVAQGIFRPSTTAKTFVLTRPFEECRKLRKVIQYLVSSKRQWGQQHEDDQEPEDHQHQHQDQHQHQQHQRRDSTSIASARSSTSSHYDGSESSDCPFCEPVRRYEAFCWEQPPLLLTNVVSGFTLFKKIVLTNSLTYFIHLARSPFPLVSANETATASNADDNGREGADQSVAIAAAASSGGTSAETRAGVVDSEQQQEQEQPPRARRTPTPFCEAQAELAILLHDFFQLQQHIK